ncbi:outer membrane lipoprotein [Klebsiella pneumoniae]|uniref:Outer membrane lipoprotein n=1 Tax=Klebsiella pneumoniae TaxID=573 RepID=A0A377U062_KLEPN|nr:outer membrane lipoprotein [Klebsiella pneumoniae]
MMHGPVRTKPSISGLSDALCAGNEYAQHQGYSRDRSAAIGLMFSVSLGASKELWDSRPAGSGWSWKDFAWDVAGATTGYAVWQLAHQ